jgi:hypothetical protein
VTKLIGYDYEITYKPGRDNNAADALSRVLGSPSFNTLFISHTLLWDTIKIEARTNPYMMTISDKAIANPGVPYNWRNGLVCYKNRMVVPPHSNIITQLLHELHDSPSGGHSGVLRTYKRQAQQFYWPSIFHTVKTYVASYEVCQRTKNDTMSPTGLLQPFPVPCQVWDDITMDFIDGIPLHLAKLQFLLLLTG